MIWDFLPLAEKCSMLRADKKNRLYLYLPHWRAASAWQPVLQDSIAVILFPHLAALLLSQPDRQIGKEES